MRITKRRKFNLYWNGGGPLQDKFIGTLWADSIKWLGETAMFTADEECILAISYVRVEECIT